jgi:hypothetical protein
VGNGSFAAPVNVATGTMPSASRCSTPTGTASSTRSWAARRTQRALPAPGPGHGRGRQRHVRGREPLASLGFAPTGLIAADVNEDGIDDLSRRATSRPSRCCSARALRACRTARSPRR